MKEIVNVKVVTRKNIIKSTRTLFENIGNKYIHPYILRVNILNIFNFNLFSFKTKPVFKNNKFSNFNTIY